MELVNAVGTTGIVAIPPTGPVTVMACVDVDGTAPVIILALVSMTMLELELRDRLPLN